MPKGKGKIKGKQQEEEDESDDSSHHEPDDEATSKIATMIAEAMKGQRLFIEKQFTGLNEKLDGIKTDLAKCTSDIQSLRSDYSILSKRMDDAERSTADNKAKFEAKIADMEDRSRRDNLRIMGVAEGSEGSNAVQYITSNISKWFPDLSEDRIEIMRAHRIPLPRNANTNSPRTLICKLLRFTDCERILKAARRTPLTLGDRATDHCHSSTLILKSMQRL